ncbi:hypothetical protein CPLU01_08845 [Colletotrichum plurivorum]|uniref:Uncharacterized protein n=1 Tax=Colletotrichum plurivorum TaxID=2175906 RepID=A0A8H6KAB6_9PEZI|nr:hypothetical protein CPLU01_08845 [Colletotrichum plurivorum]
MSPYYSSSSDFRSRLDPIPELSSDNDSQHPGDDANQRDANQLLNRSLCSSISSRDNNYNVLSLPPPPRYPTSEALHRLMMADAPPASPRPEAAEQQHLPGPAAAAGASLSSSQNQKAPSPIINPATPDAAPADPENQLEDDDDAAAEPAPKLDPAGFFTLVSNSSTNTTHHPTVKYIFADDDPDILSAALAAHHAANQASSPSASTSRGGQPNPPSGRAVLLDVVPGADGQWQVASAASLSADFAVTDAAISRQEGEKEGGLVLKIEGVESEPPGTSGAESSLPSSNSGVAKSGGEEYGPLLEDFERRMSVMRRVVKAGEDRARMARERQLAAAAEAEEKAAES